MADQLDQLDYYTLLGVDASADGDALRDAFRRFALKYHPDNHGGAARAEQIFRRGTEAYRVLRDPQQRARYNESLAAGALRLDGQEPRAPKKVALNPRARPFYVKAKQSFERGDTADAKLNLQLAMRYQPDHPDLLALQSALRGG